MTPLIDRDRERARLAELLSEGTPQLALMYGRRRVGKTYLITNAWPPDQRLFYFTAAETTPGQNRATLLDEIARFTGEQLNPADFGTWRNVFRHLVEMDGSGPLVVVLDEFQYLADGSEGALREVASQLNAVWEAKRPARQLVFVLCGSSVRLLEALNDGGSPLYGRFAWICRLEPFNYWHAAAMAPFPALRDRVAMYSVFGGTPRYLALLRPANPLRDNIARLFLDREGGVRQLVETALLQEEGLRDHATYTAILRAIGAGRTVLNEIKQGAGIEEGDLTATRDKIERLIALGYVRKARNFGAKRTQPFRYSLADPALGFYYHYVAGLEGPLEQYDPRAVFDERIAPSFDAYLGHQFEQLVPQAYRRLQPSLGLPMDDEWGRWEGTDRAGQSVEIDIVTRLTDGRMMTGGIKWSAAPINASWHERHLQCLQRLAEAGVGWAHEALAADAPILWVSAADFHPDFADAVRAKHQHAICLSLEDLFRPAR